MMPKSETETIKQRERGNVVHITWGWLGMRNARAKSSAKSQETKLSMQCTKEITNGTLLKKKPNLEMHNAIECY